MEYSRPRKLTPLDIIHYEIKMLRFCADQLPTMEEGQLKYAVLEAYLLHYRNIVEFLGWRPRYPTTDLRTVHPEHWAPPNALTDDAKRDLCLIRDGFFERFKKDYDNLSQYLQHMTNQRVVDRGWDVDDMQAKLKPSLEKFLAHFPLPS